MVRINGILREVKGAHIADGRLIFPRDGGSDCGGVTIGNASEVPLEDGVEDLGANGLGVSFPRLELPPELLPELIKYSACVALTAEGLVTVVIVTVKVLGDELGDKLDIEDGDVECLGGCLVLTAVSNLDVKRDFESAQFAFLPTQEIFQTEVEAKPMPTPVFSIESEHGGRGNSKATHL